MTDIQIALNWLSILQSEHTKWDAPVFRFMKTAGMDGKDSPFRVLISTILSSRTKDETTDAAVTRLFAAAKTPQQMQELPEDEIARLIYPVGFYRTKAKNIREVCAILNRQYGGRTPDTMDELLGLPGVGIKTASLTLSQAFGIPAICVDIHVHRIFNRWNVAATKTPDETERELRRILPVEWWIPVNSLLVAFGQTLCTPIGPKCSICSIASECPKRDVKKSR